VTGAPDQLIPEREDAHRSPLGGRSRSRGRFRGENARAKADRLLNFAWRGSRKKAGQRVRPRVGQRRKMRLKSDRQPRSERSRRDAREASLARCSCSTSSILSRVRSVISSLRSGDGVERIGPRESSKTRAATRKEMITQLRIVGCEPVSNAVGSAARGTIRVLARPRLLGGQLAQTPGAAVLRSC
jgi:hypothetical protein